MLLPVPIVFPCALSLDAYASAGADVEVPRPDCPGCSAPMRFWWGYWRYVREGGAARRVFVRRASCKPCRSTQALLPSFLVARRRDTAEVIGEAVEHVAVGTGGARGAAQGAAVPHTTARAWLRRFRHRARQIAVAFAAVAVELGGEVVVPTGEAMAAAVAAVAAAFSAACVMPGWAATGRWRFASAVTGGELLAANTVSPFYVLGKRRFMPPVPSRQGETWNQVSANGLPSSGSG